MFLNGMNGTPARRPLATTLIVAALLAGTAFAGFSGLVQANDKKAAPAAAEAQAEDQMIKLGNPTVAVVDGEEIKRADVFNFIGALPEQVRQMPIQTLFPLAQEQVINNKLVGKKAAGAGLEADPKVAELVEQAKGQIIRNVYLEREVEAQITQKKLLKSYDDMLSKFERVDEVHARHILVDTEEKAKEIITKLDGGASFDDLAKEYSAGPSAQSGGDLGYFAKAEMVPEFADAAFAIEKGKHSATPVKTQFGWHVIRVEDKRKRPEPEFEAVKPQLEAQLRQETLNDLVSKWQKDAKIQKFDINGEPVKEEKPAKEEKKKKK